MLLFAFESRLFSMLLGSKLYEANGFSFGESVMRKFREHHLGTKMVKIRISHVSRCNGTH
jgi:hypothetical protein